MTTASGTGTPRAAPEGGWLHLLNPANVVTIRRRDGWWRAWDVRGNGHEISGDDDAKVEALAGVAGDPQ